jgi:NAD(P)H dehydrogenase (quinone)
LVPDAGSASQTGSLSQAYGLGTITHGRRPTLITITAASGQLGRLILDALLRRGVRPADIVATTRDVTRLQSYADRGIMVRHADYTDPASLAAAFADVDRLLLISSGEFGRQAEQHRNVIDAAVSAGASGLAYTSYLNADTSGIIMAADHFRTECMIRESGLPYAILRNGSYIENYTGFIGFWLQFGTFTASGGSGRISGAARRDFAEAAAAVISGEQASGQIYELGGPAYTFADLAAEASARSGVAIRYDDLPVAEYASILMQGTGMPQHLAEALADNSAGAARGAWYTDSDDLERLIGRRPTPVRDVVAEALAATKQRA